MDKTYEFKIEKIAARNFLKRRDMHQLVRADTIRIAYRPKVVIRTKIAVPIPESVVDLSDESHKLSVLQSDPETHRIEMLELI